MLGVGPDVVRLAALRAGSVVLIAWTELLYARLDLAFSVLGASLESGRILKNSIPPTVDNSWISFYGWLTPRYCHPGFSPHIASFMNRACLYWLERLYYYTLIMHHFIRLTIVPYSCRTFMVSYSETKALFIVTCSLHYLDYNYLTCWPLSLMIFLDRSYGSDVSILS